MAIGASGGEVFKGFMTEALLLTGLGSLVGLAGGIAFSAVITSLLKIPLFMQPTSFACTWGWRRTRRCPPRPLRKTDSTS